MPRGTPDGKIVQNLYSAQESDLAQVSNMLWGFSPIDGRGRIFFLDTFNNGLGGWEAATQGAATPATIETTTSHFMFSPPNTVALHAGTIAADMSSIFRNMYLGKSLRIGIEVGFMADSAAGEIEIVIDYNPATQPAYIPKLSFKMQTGQGTLKTEGVTILTPGVPPGSFPMLMQMKMVCDFGTGKHVRVLFGDQLIDTSSLSMTPSVISYQGALACSIRQWSAGAGTPNPLYIGYVLLTKDEP